MTVWYLDTDDEITDAVARLRKASDEEVVFVVPPGSRIATGRINFKLLAREAAARDLRMAIASPDEQVRALAASAGVLGLATADEAEAALQRGDEPPEASSGEVPAEAQTTTRSTQAAPPEDRRLFGLGRRGLTVTTVVLVALGIGGGYAALETLPTAEVTLAPRTTAIGPIAVAITALTSVSEIDPENGRVPAVEVPIPLRVEGTFGATGTRSTETRATGQVIFSSPEQAFDQQVVAGTRLRTPAGVEFQTTAAVTLPRIAASGPARIAALIEAVEPGEAGNVAAGAISVVPSLQSQGISVSNPKPTVGGRIEATPVVTAADYDAAAVDLQNRLAGELAAYLRDPANTPQGLTLFTETTQTGPVRHDPPADEIVGTTSPDFSLSGSLEAEVLAVDVAAVEEATLAVLRAALPDDSAFLPGSMEAQTGEGLAQGERISFDSTAAGTAYRIIDADAVIGQIAGLPISEAQAILEALGTTSVTVWPDFVGDLPGDTSRITLDVREPSTTE